MRLRVSALLILLTLSVLAAGAQQPSPPPTIDTPIFRSTIDAIERYLVGDHQREPQYEARAQQAFTFHDRDNSRRAVEAIEHLVRTRGIS